jgi:hypothetical protein
VEHLYILEFGLHNWQDYVESSQRLELLHPFITVKCFYISQYLVPHIAPVMQDIGGKRVAEVLPALQSRADSFLGGLGTTPILAPFETCPGIHWEVCSRKATCQSPSYRVSLEKIVVRSLIVLSY